MPARRLRSAALALLLPLCLFTVARADESLRDLRADVAAGHLDGADALCDRLAAAYADAAAKPPADQAPVARFMGCYCLYAKAQILALQHQLPEAQAAVAAADARRSADPSFANPRLQPLWQELSILTRGLILEKSRQPDAAIQAYLPATYGPISSTNATGRLALIEWQRGHADKARSWAFIHADDPTSAYVLAQLALRAKNAQAARRHANLALSQIQKALAAGKEYLPIYFAEAPAIRAFLKKLPPAPTPRPALVSPPPS